MERLQDFFHIHPLEGKIINVVNQIPFHCYLNQPNDETVVQQLALNPISQLDRRRSTIVALGQTNIWQLSTRRGHSAMYAALDSLKKDYRTLYIGGTGPILTHPDKLHIEPTQEQQQTLTELLRSKHDMVPLFIEENLSMGHYEGYSKQVLWPLMHYLMWSDTVDEKQYWQDYVQVNQIYADQVIKHYEEGDIIWVHDYHLMLVPQMIRNVLPNALIGLFVHTPFPSSEIFRCLPRKSIGRKEVLKGMLGANVIGFQTYNYARHFASNCTRIMGYEYTPSGILAHGVLIHIEIYPIGIDVERTRQHCLSPGVEPKASAMRQRYATKKIIIGRDKLDPVKGVLQKLEAFEIFLRDYPEWRDKVVLIQVTSPGVLHSPELEKKTSEIVARINAEYGSLEFTPVNLFNQHIDRDEYYALLKVADIGLVTPVIDGMNTSSFEYIVAQENGHQSPLVLSEFTGTANSMGAAVIVNPWDRNEIARAIAECLSMGEEEKILKYEQLHAFVTSHTASYWAKSLVKGLLQTNKCYWGDTAPLDVSRLQQEYQNKRKRAFFFDYDGTLVPIVNEPEKAKPDKQVIQALTQLASDPSNIVWVVSGRTQDYISDCLGQVPHLGLASEHGCFIKEPDHQTWTTLVHDTDLSWREDVRAVFDYYTERTPGSFIEEKECSMTWHYRKADPKFGAFQARELQNHLDQNVVGKLPVECINGKKNVEARPSLVHKGSVIHHVVKSHPDIDYVVCAGDDRSDEDMFRMLERISSNGLEAVQFNLIVAPIDKNTLAKWKVKSSQELIATLKALV
ncbi:threalose-6-phosphate phosphatase [Rhizopus stolonifer]|uniref:Threalose-6-phosphate phosphatase n=1 Tax=Rhizopus stolonifer TaxID=4846 RepID=A0A367KQG6_RHIST|nr:threalose-6-phosphate phosphatase [Rhizopus stolonifer]